MKLYLDSCEGFAGMSSRDTGGRTPFLSACCGQEYSKQVFSFLLDRGANVSDLDSACRSCLHLCLKTAGGSDRIEKQLEALICLIERGADVWARDHAGQSVSHVVYSLDFFSYSFGSYRRDLWDLVLTASGYDVLKVLGNFRRVGWYPKTEHYSRTHFRRLWEGREHLCPYPEDLEDTGSDGTHQFNLHAENSNSNVDGSNSSSSKRTESNDEDERKRRMRRMRCVRCKMRHTGGPECSRCGWSFGCRDSHCRHCNPDHSGNSLRMTGESSPELQDEASVISEALPSDSTAEAWPGALQAESSPFIHSPPDHLSVGVET